MLLSMPLLVEPSQTLLDVRYVTQHPDEDCAHLIAQSGIREVKYMRNDERGNPDHEENAKRIFALGRVSLLYVTGPFLHN